MRKNYKQLVLKDFFGIDLDSSPERIKPGFFYDLQNMKVSDKGVVESMDGCTYWALKDANGDDHKDWGIRKYSLFKAPPGDDYLVAYHSDGKVRTFNLVTHRLDTEIIPATDKVFTDETWFAEHMGEMFFGNMADGVWRWSPGNQPLMRGSAPLDVIVELGGAGEANKEYLDWIVAYDYEHRGGRSALSRRATAHLSRETQILKVIMDTPPTISANRRIYVSPDAGVTWYMVKEVTDNNEVMIELDSELETDNLTVEYSEVPNICISPQARMGINYNNRIWLGYLTESPTLVVYSEIGKPHFEQTNYFDLEDPITNLLGFGPLVIATTNRRVFALSAEEDRVDTITDAMGAFRGTLSYGSNGLLFANSYGVYKYTKQGIQRIGTDEYFTADRAEVTRGVSSLLDDLIADNIKKEKRFAIWTSQRNFEQGIFYDGVTGAAIPGALALKSIPTGKHLIDRQKEDASADLFNTKDYPYAQSFIVTGGTASKYTLKGISLNLRRKEGTTDPLVGIVRADDGSDFPSKETDDILATFSADTSLSWGSIYFELVESIILDKDTQYWIELPQQGGSTGWEIAALDFTNLYPRGLTRFYNTPNWENDGDRKCWNFQLWGWSDSSLISVKDKLTTWSTYWVRSDENYYAQKFIVSKELAGANRVEILAEKILSPAALTGDVYSHDSTNDAPDAKLTTTFTLTKVTGGDYVYSATLSHSLTAGIYWLITNKVGDASNYYKIHGGERQGDYEIWKESTDAVTWSGDGTGWDGGGTLATPIFHRIYADVTEGEFEKTGYWVSDEFEILSADDFKKVYVTYHQPEGSTIKIEINEYVGSWQGWKEINTVGNPLPYNIIANTTKVKFQITLELGTALYTPSVDSILVTYIRSGDEGDRLYAGTINGEYYLSKVDDDADGSDEYTLLHTKHGTWNRLSEPFIDFIQIKERRGCVIGFNQDGDENIYTLQNGAYWYTNDGDKLIVRYLETGWILYSTIFKKLRKLFLGLSGDTGQIYLEILTRNPEDQTFNTVIDIGSTDVEDLYISLPGYMEGKMVKIKLYMSDVKFNLHKIDLRWREFPERNIRIPTVTSWDELMAHPRTMYGDEMRLRDLTDKTSPTIIGTYENPESQEGYVRHGWMEKEHLIAMDKGGDMFIWFVDKSNLTFKSELYIASSADNYNPIVTDKTMNYAFTFGGAAYGVKMYAIDISDKSNPVAIGSFDIFTNLYQISNNIVRFGNRLVFTDETNNKIHVVDISNPHNPELKYSSSIDIGGSGGHLAAIESKNLLAFVHTATNYVYIYSVGETKLTKLAEKEFDNKPYYKHVSWDNETSELYVPNFHNAYVWIEKYDIDLNKLDEVSLEIDRDLVQCSFSEGCLYVTATQADVVGKFSIFTNTFKELHSEQLAKWEIGNWMTINNKNS